jgi:hypothetical protein
MHLLGHNKGPPFFYQGIKIPSACQGLGVVLGARAVFRNVTTIAVLVPVVQPT